MPLATIAQALPYMNWILLVSLALGSLAFVVFIRQFSEVTNGYAGLTAFSAGLLGGLALLSDFGLPRPDRLIIEPAAAELDLLRQAGLAGFAGLSLAYVVAIRRGRRTMLVGAIALASGLLALIAAALGWAPTLADVPPLLIQLVVLTAAAGGALATLVLAHWYLVTPRLSEQPLVLLTRLLTMVVGLQLALFVTWSTLGGGPGQGAFDAFAPQTLFFVILRFGVTICFAGVLCTMALRTATTRSMESTTGLLYIALAAILAGTIGAGALYVSAGLLV